MVDLPIIFSGPMVRAQLAGRKTQTRRVLKGGPERLMCRTCGCSEKEWKHNGCKCVKGDLQWTPCDLPRYAVGDRLWVREAHAFVGTVDPGWLLYRADGYDAECIRHGFTRPVPPESSVSWVSPIFMPRRLSRLTNIVTEVRVQRLQDITEEDAIAEGVDAVTMEAAPRQASMSRRSDFAALWNSLHGPDAWDRNDWVAAYTYTVHQGNIDNLPKGGAA